MTNVHSVHKANYKYMSCLFLCFIYIFFCWIFSCETLHHWRHGKRKYCFFAGWHTFLPSFVNSIIYLIVRKYVWSRQFYGGSYYTIICFYFGNCHIAFTAHSNLLKPKHKTSEQISIALNSINLATNSRSIRKIWTNV